MRHSAYIAPLALLLVWSSRGAPLPNVTISGYASVEDDSAAPDAAALFYAFYEAQERTNRDTPVLLWLQGGPGCASMFGNLYELGPQRIVEDNLTLEPNPWAWNRRVGLLFVDQPIGTGYSTRGSRDLPTDEATVASDLYVALQRIFGKHASLTGRPLIVAGESYAGKYVPSLAHYILSMVHNVTVPRALPPRMLRAGAPRFVLAGAAIGNGLTAPDLQVMSHADVAYSLGLVSVEQSIRLLKAQLAVQQQVFAQDWNQAWHARVALLDLLSKFSGAATLLDVRRDQEYDASGAVERYLDQADVKAHLGVPDSVRFRSCSARVGEALGPDVMQTVLHLLPDVLHAVPLLLYQGQYDVQDGPASCSDWIHVLPWAHQEEFNRAPRTALREGHVAERRRLGAGPGAREGRAGPVVGWWQSYGHLTSVVVRDAGHMVPHDQGRVAAYMIERWLDSLTMWNPV